MHADEQGQPSDGCNPPYETFTAGDVVTVELKRAPGVEGVLRVGHGGAPRELRELPRDGMLYPIVGLCHSTQSVITMVACLELPVNAVNAASASP